MMSWYSRFRKKNSTSCAAWFAKRWRTCTSSRCLCWWRLGRGRTGETWSEAPAIPARKGTSDRYQERWDDWRGSADEDNPVLAPARLSAFAVILYHNPNSAWMAPAIASVSAFMRDSDSASTITLAKLSVPE